MVRMKEYVKDFIKICQIKKLLYFCIAEIVFF